VSQPDPRAGEPPGRLRSDVTWAHLCDAAPIPASSGNVTRHRLNTASGAFSLSAIIIQCFLLFLFGQLPQDRRRSLTVSLLAHGVRHRRRAA
jgi:hypothetical protein